MSLGLSKLLRLRREKTRQENNTIAFDVTQQNASIRLQADGVNIDFSVEGIELLPASDASFAVWALLPVAMRRGFNIQINRPIDPLVAANAEYLSKIWEMWVPSLYRSVRITGAGEWSRTTQTRSPCIHLYSGGVDSTFAILKYADAQKRGHVLTIYGLDYRRGEKDKSNFDKLISKTEPLLKELNYQRVIVRTSAKRVPHDLTHGFTLAACLFLLSDLFEEGTIAADLTHAQDMVAFPWGTNHVTNQYFTGSDFRLRTVCAVGRTEKLATIAASEIGLPFLSCCRQEDALPGNCGTCPKCIRTKAMFIAATGKVPDVFLDTTLDEDLMSKLDLEDRFERASLFDLYSYAQEQGTVHKIPGLLHLVERCRNRGLKIDAGLKYTNKVRS
jgi:7-cyano-7-deazaguanine synthase in queuosine biosynthesis